MDAEDDDFQIDNKPYRLKSTQNTTQPPKNQPKRKISKQGTKNTSKMSEPTKASETVLIDLTSDLSFVSSTQSTKVVKKRKIADPNLETTNRKKNWRNVPPKNQPLITEMFSKLNMSMSKEGKLDIGRPICSSTPKKTDLTANENCPIKSKQSQLVSSPKKAIENDNFKEANKESDSIVLIPDEDSLVCLADNNIKVHPSVTIKKPMEVVGCKNAKPKPKRKEISLKSQPKPPKNSNIVGKSNSNNGATKKAELIKNKNNIIFTNQVNVKSLVPSVNKANQKCASQQARTIENNLNLPSCITVIPTSQTNSSIVMVQTKPKPLALRIRNPEEINKMKRTSPIKKQPMQEINKILPSKQQNTLKPKSSNQNKSITKKQNINTNNKATNKDANQGIKRAATDNISPEIATPSKIAKLGNDKSELVNKKTLVANEKNGNLSIAKKIAPSVPQSLQKSSNPSEAPKNRPTIFQERQNLPDIDNPIPSTSKEGITQCTSSSSNILSSHQTSNKLINQNPIQNSSTDKANPIEKANVEIDNNISTVNKKTLVVKEKNVNLSNVKKIAPSLPQSLQKSTNPSEAPKNRPTIFQERQNLPDIDNPIPSTSNGGITQCTSSSSNIVSSHQLSNKLVNQNPIQNSTADKATEKATHKINNNTTSANKEHIDENNSTPDTTQPFVVIPDTTVLDVKNTSAIMVEKVDIDHKARKRFSRIFGKLQDVNVKKESREDDLMIDNPNDFEKSASAAFGTVYSRKLESNADIEKSTSYLQDMNVDEDYDDEFEAKWDPIDDPTGKGDDSNSPIIINACSSLLENVGNRIKVDLHSDIPKVHVHNDDMMKYEVCDRIEPVNTSNDEIPVQRKPSEKVQVKVKDRVYDISLEPTPTNSQTMNDDAESTIMVNDVNNTSQQSQEKQDDTEGPLPHAYDVVLQMVQGLQLSGPVLTTDMLLGEVKKILENRSSADLRIGDEYIVRFDLKEP